MSEGARSVFQEALREALDTYYFGWRSRGSAIEAELGIDTETLAAWVETDQHPQTGSFERFLKKGNFPHDVRATLRKLFQQLPPRTRKKKQADTPSNDVQVDEWCIASSTGINSLGKQREVYFDAQAKVRNFDENPYYIYFDGEYVTGDNLHLEGFDRTKNYWIFIIENQWIEFHPQWQIPSLWKVHFLC